MKMVVRGLLARQLNYCSRYIQAPLSPPNQTLTCCLHKIDGKVYLIFVTKCQALNYLNSSRKFVNVTNRSSYYLVCSAAHIVMLRETMPFYSSCHPSHRANNRTDSGDDWSANNVQNEVRVEVLTDLPPGMCSI